MHWQILFIISTALLVALCIFIKYALDEVYKRGKKKGRLELSKEIQDEVEVFMENKEHQQVVYNQLEVLRQSLENKSRIDIASQN